MKKSALLAIALLLLAGSRSFGQAANSLPSIIKRDGRYALMVDGKPFLVMGGQAHNSSAWPAMLPQLWDAVQKLHANTLEVPIYWEQVEPQKGSFDFSLVDTLLAQSRQHHARLVFLWFATWKNGSSHYMPEWMKREPSKYPNVTGSKGQPMDSPSPNTVATLEADSRAFSVVMHHLKQADPQHTVIMMQVENEPGSWGTVRDYSPMAQRMFEGPVPAKLLKPEVLSALNVPAVSSGSWKSVFGDRADEYFQAWSVAKFVGEVAAAGKAEYPLPMYSNAALRDPLTNPMANSYESGGATDNVIPIWKAAAPAIDIVAPDIYLSGSERVLKVIALYGRPDNPLLVPEAGLETLNAKYFYEVIAHNGIGFSPFGIDENKPGATSPDTGKRLAPFAQEYAMAAPMMRELAQWSFEGKVKAAVEHDDHAEQTIDLGYWTAVIKFGSFAHGTLTPNIEPTGKAMFIKLTENKFMITGTLCHISFRPTAVHAGQAWQYLKVEEGNYANGEFKPVRILNGDETDWGGPSFGTEPTLLQATLIMR